jgi:DNA-binding HxlR family transcriptional regulator
MSDGIHAVGGKWKAVILCYLNQRPCRYSELRKLMPKVSDKILAERLRDLVAAELVVHQKGGCDSPGNYALTSKARSLSDVLHMLYRWGHDHAAEFNVQVGEPLTALDRKS